MMVGAGSRGSCDPTPLGGRLIVLLAEVDDGIGESLHNDSSEVGEGSRQPDMRRSSRDAMQLFLGVWQYRVSMASEESSPVRIQGKRAAARKKKFWWGRILSYRFALTVLFFFSRGWTHPTTPTRLLSLFRFSSILLRFF